MWTWGIKQSYHIACLRWGKEGFAWVAAHSFIKAHISSQIHMLCVLHVYCVFYELACFLSKPGTINHYTRGATWVHPDIFPFIMSLWRCDHPSPIVICAFEGSNQSDLSMACCSDRKGSYKDTLSLQWYLQTDCLQVMPANHGSHQMAENRLGNKVHKANRTIQTTSHSCRQNQCKEKKTVNAQI